MRLEPHDVHKGLAVYRFGAGEPVFLMPGPHRFQRPGMDSADALIDGLTALGRSVITFDPPGSGRSTRSAVLGMPEMHACTDEALTVCGLPGPVDAVGHSMGGLTLLAYALEHPARVRRMVLVGTGTGGRAYLKAPGALWHRGHPGFAKMALLGSLHLAVRRLATERLLNNDINRQSFVDRRRAGRDPVSLADWFCPAAGRAEWHRIARRLDYGPRLEELTMPVLVLCGRHDPQFPPACSTELASGIRDAELHWFEHSGHYPFVEDARPFWQSVARFLGAPLPA